jgi:hypothetical protein
MVTNNNSVFRNTSNNTSNNINSIKPFKQGLIVKNVNPNVIKSLQGLKDLTFLQVTNKPGVYVLYFPSENVFYVGQALNMSRDITRYKNDFRIINNFDSLGNLMTKNKEKMEQYALYQGEGLENISIRLKLEKEVINVLGDKCFNASGKEGYVNYGARKPPEEKLKISYTWESLSQADLHYTGIAPVSHQGKAGFEDGCIYLFFHPVTKRFYIGQSSGFFGARVVNRHRRNIYEYLTAKARGPVNVTGTSARIYGAISEDCVKHGRELTFTILEYLPGLTEPQRVQREKQYLTEARQLYGERLYNSYGRADLVYTTKQTPAQKARVSRLGKERVKEGSITEANPCVIKGRWYESQNAAAAGIPTTVSTVSKHVRNPAYKDWISLREPLGKPLPNDPVILKKAAVFYEKIQKKSS